MAKIRKNLSDADMLIGFKEKITFENDIIREESVPQSKNPVKREAGQDLNNSFITPELHEKIGRALLEMKLNLFKQGIVDYKIKVDCQGDQVILKASPVRRDNK